MWKKPYVFLSGFILVLASAGTDQVLAKGSKSKSGGVLTGRLTVTAPYRKTAPQAPQGHEGYGYAVPDGSAHSLPEQVVIYLEKVPGKYHPSQKHAQLDQKYLQFTSRVLPVLKGTVVDFTNHDPVYHNIFSNSQINKLELGRKKNGETVSVKMNKAEVPVKLYCDIHSAMKAYILVLENPFFTTVGPDQTFEIKGIPPGTYDMVAWHDFWTPVRQTVKIRKGKTTTADVILEKDQN